MTMELPLKAVPSPVPYSLSQRGGSLPSTFLSLPKDSPPTAGSPTAGLSSPSTPNPLYVMPDLLVVGKLGSAAVELTDAMARPL
jgi:hypothetical protein